MQSLGAGAVLGSGVHGNKPEVADKVMTAIADRVLFLMANRYTFDHIHKRITKPYDYYQFGQVTRPVLSERAM